MELTGLIALLGVVAFGAVVPVVPTGAAVSAAAVIGWHETWWQVPVVAAVGATGAYVGDLITYAALRAAGRPLAVRLHWLRSDHQEARLRRMRESIERHELRTLLVSRLLPGGRIPVLLVAAFTGYSWLRFATVAVVAAALWAVMYAAIGLAGGSLFKDTSTAVILASAAAVLVTAALHVVRRRRRPA